MFIYDNFCHSASNDRVQNQSAIFLYKTIDTLQQMTTAGYFNRAKLDLHIGDIIFATVETIKETTSYDTYVFRVLTVNEPITVEQISLGTVTSVNGVQPVAGNVEITGDNITATVGEEEATITQHLATLKNDEAELGEQVQGLQQSINGKQDALTAEQLTAVNSGITSAKVASYDAYAGEISAKVNIDQGEENAGKVMTVGADGNVVPTAGYATQSWVETQITNSIGSIETALAEV